MAYLVVRDLLANLAVLVNVACPVLMVKTVNRDPRVFRVFPDPRVLLESVVLW